MARVAGVNIPDQKRIDIALSYIYGIGRKSTPAICKKAGIAVSKRTGDLTDEDILKLRTVIDNDYIVEGEKKRKVSMDIKTLIDMGCYRGVRHRKRLPVRGQRTSSNARTRKGKAIAIAGKKK